MDEIGNYHFLPVLFIYFSGLNFMLLTFNRLFLFYFFCPECVNVIILIQCSFFVMCLMLLVVCSTVFVVCG